MNTKPNPVAAAPATSVGATAAAGARIPSRTFPRARSARARTSSCENPFSHAPSARARIPSRTLRPGTLSWVFVLLALFIASADRAVADNVFSTRIAPLLTDRCGACHGQSRQKGDLALHTPEAIAKGGESGPALIAGKPAESELIRRLRLPLDDSDHMPPEGKPQLTPDEIAAIESWIAAGAAFDAPTATQPAAPAVAARPPAAVPSQIPAPDASAVRALRSQLVHVEPVSHGARALTVDFAAIASTSNDALIKRLLEPLLPQLEDLSLARCPVTDETAAMLARAPHLKRLDLRGARVTDAGIAALAQLPALRELVLAQTRVTDASIAHLAAITSLQRVRLWKTGITSEGLDRLRKSRPTLQVDSGDARVATTREAETEIKLTSTAPPPQTQPAASAQSQPAAPSPAPQSAVAAVALGAANASPPSARAATSATQPAAVPPNSAAPTTAAPGVRLSPLNATCPVSGKPVDPRYTIVHQGRLIAFCCPNCPATFWSDPAKYEAKLTAR